MKYIFIVICFFNISFAQDINFLERKAMNNDADAQYHLGSAYYWGNKVPRDLKKAAEWYKKAADLGHEKAMLFLGDIYFYSDDDNFPQDKEKAIGIYKVLSNLNNAPAKLRLAGAYYDGEGTPQNYKMAVDIYYSLSGKGYDNVEFMLGHAYFYGNGVPQNYNIAKEHFYSLASKEYPHSKSQYYMGKMYLYGYGVRNDLTQAKEWFGKSCDNGNQDGCDAYRELNTK